MIIYVNIELLKNLVSFPSLGIYITLHQTTCMGGSKYCFSWQFFTLCCYNIILSHINHISYDISYIRYHIISYNIIYHRNIKFLCHFSSLPPSFPNTVFLHNAFRLHCILTGGGQSSREKWKDKCKKMVAADRSTSCYTASAADSVKASTDPFSRPLGPALRIMVACHISGFSHPIFIVLNYTF